MSSTLKKRGGETLIPVRVYVIWKDGGSIRNPEVKRNPADCLKKEISLRGPGGKHWEREGEDGAATIFTSQSHKKRELSLPFLPAGKGDIEFVWEEK